MVKALTYKILRSAVSGEGSNPSILVLFSVIFFMLVILSYLKNRMLMTLDSDFNSEKEDNNMGKVAMLKCLAASVIDVIQALGTSLVVFGGPLT
ncbi:hypothetical protein [uncultured Psychrobacter sp.]|uniref:hypothetical protein n=1 Tax=Psychrobacter sp. DM4 TaxID=3440637 RepID=UPI00293D57D5|nr:hypothetical protein [uncultured Psychrobacter sp.]